MQFSRLLQQLIDHLRYLPGVGPKSAQRMALHLLTHQREAGYQIAEVINKALDGIQQCSQCQILSEEPLCFICANQQRNTPVLCIVGSPADVIALEQTADFKGKYFVLNGYISPLENRGPDQIGIPRLKKRLEDHTLEEVVLATSATVEGETTAHYIADLVKKSYSIKVSRIAYGIPLGGELEYLNSDTLAQALHLRREIN